MSFHSPAPLLPDDAQAFLRAKTILEAEPQAVIMNIMYLLQEARPEGGLKLDEKATAAMVKIVQLHVEKQHEITKAEIEAKAAQDKADAEAKAAQVKAVTDAETKKETNSSTRFLFCGGILFFGFICWLFLSYGKPEFITPVFAGVTGFLGGLGWGKASAAEKK